MNKFNTDTSMIDFLKHNASPVELTVLPSIRPGNVYYKAGYEGTSEKMLCRQAVLLQMEKAQRLLQNGYEFHVFDAFRTKKTQRYLFDKIKKDMAEKYPVLSPEELMMLTRRFVAHPDEVSRFPIAPHNSGGALDLTLYSQGHPVEMGTEFDEMSALAATLFFENEFDPSYGIPPQKWEEIRHNRRLLLDCMTEVGFVNYPHEWWHFDLGDCFWAEIYGSSWSYGSLEE